MPLPDGWSATTAVAKCAVMPWSGRVWRGHSRHFSASSYEGSLLFSGRFNRGRDTVPEGEAWPALYLADNPAAVLGEMLRHFISDIPLAIVQAVANDSNAAPAGIAEHLVARLASLNTRAISELDVELSDVLNCCDVSSLGLKPLDEQPADLYHDTDFVVGQTLAEAVIARGCEAMLIPSATGFGNSLVVFPTSVKPDSQIEVIATKTHHLFVDRRS